MDFGNAFSALLVQTVFPVLGALVLGFVSWACQKIGTKYKIEALTQQNNFVTSLATQGVAFAEEKGANYAKQLKPLSNNDKLNSAVAYVMQMAPAVSQEQAQSLVTSALALLPGVGATGNAVVGSTAPVPAPAPPATTTEANPLAVAP